MLHKLRHSLFPPPPHTKTNTFTTVTATTTTKFPLLDLPNELLLSIAWNLSTKDLFNFLLANRHLSSLLTSTLYNRLPIGDTSPTSLAEIAFILRRAVCSGHENIVKILLAKNVTIPIPTAWDESLLHLAVRSGNTTMLKEILALSPPEPPFLGAIGITPLQIAVLLSDAEMAKILLAHDFPIHPHSEIESMNTREIIDTHAAQWGNSYTALHYAAQRGDLYFIELLLKHGADPNVRTTDEAGMTPLHLVLRRGPAEPENAIRILMAHGADITMVDPYGRTAMHLAAANQNHIRSRQEKTFEERWAAGIASHKAVLELLITLGVGVNGRDKFGKTPLHYVVDEMIYADIYCKNLSEVGADMKAVTYEGETALHLLVESHSFASITLGNMCKVLLECGVDRDAKDMSGRSVLDRADPEELGRGLGRAMEVDRLLWILGKPDKNLFKKLKRISLELLPVYRH